MSRRTPTAPEKLQAMSRGSALASAKQVAAREAVIRLAHELTAAMDELTGTTSHVRCALWTLRSRLNALHQRHEDA